jgi:beta-xylosidase
MSEDRRGKGYRGGRRGGKNTRLKKSTAEHDGCKYEQVTGSRNEWKLRRTSPMGRETAVAKLSWKLNWPHLLSSAQL